jgi:FMN phosphatase YigB (HAD superfamily)
MRRNIVFIALITLLCGHTITPQEGPIKYAICDLGGVLVETNKIAAFTEVGYTPLIQFAAYNITRLFALKKMIHRELLYPFLTSLEERHPEQVAARDPENGLIPQIMCTHFKGDITDAQLRTHIDRALTTDIRLHAIEKNMLRALTTMMFTPERFIKTQYLVTEGKEFVRECVKKGLKPCIHSTWARESFELLKQQDPEFFALFEDRIFISGQTGLMKPDPASFTTIVTTLQISDTSDCVFFDDRPENISTARACGMHAQLITQKSSCLQPWKRLPDFDKARELVEALVKEQCSAPESLEVMLGY